MVLGFTGAPVQGCNSHKDHTYDLCIEIKQYQIKQCQITEYNSLYNLDNKIFGQDHMSINEPHGGPRTRFFTAIFDNPNGGPHLVFQFKRGPPCGFRYS